MGSRDPIRVVHAVARAARQLAARRLRGHRPTLGLRTGRADGGLDAVVVPPRVR